MDQGSSEMNRTQKAAARYVGDAATGYDAKRRDRPMWAREEAVLRDMLAPAAGLRLLDCPVGTGRFLPLWRELGYMPTGADISTDMLEEAAKHSAEAPLYNASIFKLPFPNDAFDIAVAIRIITLIEERDMIKALAELQRVTARRIIFNTRVGARRNAQSLDVIRASLRPGWKLTRDIEIHEPTFRMIELCAG
jgi:ubiquinone/menaquinone biosynthesis C-methylase UbiE